MIVKLLSVLILSFVVCVIATPLVMNLAKRLKLRQTVLHYVDNHASKSGTPTMGGIAFVLSVVVVTIIFMRGNTSLTVMLVALILGFAIIGFLDDFIKVYFRRNEGLTPWQKIFFQISISIVISLFVYYSPFVADKLYLPFTLIEVRLGVFAVPFYTIIFIAFTNAVNLTDGLDGLAGKTALTYTLFFSAILSIIVFALGVDKRAEEEYINLIIFCVALVGALCGFLLFNSYPAKIFMGDTGSLALGGALAGLAIMSKLSLIAPIVGIVYVITCLSDIIQVLHYKRTKRRVFLMAPLHHHFERKGVHENKIVTVYTLVTALAGAITLVLILIFS